VIQHDLLPRLAGRLIPGVISRGEAGAVYLTFDDGPDAVVTPLVLDILREQDARATFFVTGGQAAQFPEIVRRAARDGHSLGIHGYAHRRLVRMSREAVIGDLTQARQAVIDATGESPRLFRPPYGSLTRRLLRAARESGLTVVLWSRSARDWKPATRDQLIRRITSGIAEGEIILLHDRGEFAGALVNALPEAIRRLQERFPLGRL